MTENYFIFVLICAALAVLTALAVALPMWRTSLKDSATASGDDTDMDIYRDQLAEVERDLERGVLDATEAERTRVEVSRRLLAADAGARAASREAPRIISRSFAAIVGVALLAAAGGLYWQLGALGYGDLPRAERIAAGEERRANRPSQQEAEAEAQQVDRIGLADQETREMLQALRAIAFERPGELQAWAFLSQVEAGVGNMQRAAVAQSKVIELLGDNASDDDYVRFLDFLVAGTDGYVSPEAELIALDLLRNNPDNHAALYYAGLMYAQNDRPDRAFALWRRVIENGDPDSFHWQLTARLIGDAAAQIGMDYTVPDSRGPSADDIEAAQDMAPDDRQAMIEGMVAQLSDRLATEGGPPQDWARLISALVVLGDEDTARAIYAEAETVFAGDAQAVAVVRAAAQDAGLIE